MKKYFLLLLLFSILFVSCSNKDNTIEEEYTPIPYTLEVPELFQQKLIDPLIPNNNPLTEEGVALGKKLFFDKKLSGNNTQACATCHKPQNSFTDDTRFSDGIEGVFGVSFKIKGSPKDLKTTVNPIKTLTPRFITRTLEKIKKN
mgnify:CR=1 FL=1